MTQSTELKIVAAIAAYRQHIVELLGWYKRFREPVLVDIDLVSGRVFD